MQATAPNPLAEALGACRRVLVAVALFSACVNLLLLTIGNVDTRS